MLFPIVADTHYGDFKGTFSFSGQDYTSSLEILLEQKVDLPAGYTVVGFGLDISWENGPTPGHRCNLTVYATNVVGQRSPGKLRDYARDHDVVPVRAFQPEVQLQPLDLMQLFEKIKEFQLVGVTREAKDMKMVPAEDE